MSEKIQIFIKLLDGKTKTITIEPTAMVELFMERVKEITEMPLHYQRLIVNGKQLHPDRYLSDYGIKNLDTVFLTARLLGASNEIQMITIKIKKLEGLPFTVSVSPQISVKGLKKAIQDVDGVYWEDQRIVYNSELLDDGMALELYGIREGSEVYMLKEMKKCSCSLQGCV